MKPGMIMLWYGSIATIPTGWTLCDGTNGTPDLQNKFVMGAGVPLLPPGSVGGNISHKHAFTGDGHAHGLASGTYVIDSAPAGDFGHTTETTPASGDTDDTDGRPPYHVLCYIMKTPVS